MGINKFLIFLCIFVWICTILCSCHKTVIMQTYLSAKHTSFASLPNEWDWRNISKKDSELWQKLFHKPIAVGTYTSRVFNQHMSKWCGCCYLIAVIQSIQDKLNLAFGIRSPYVIMKPFLEVDAQLAMDAYNMHRRQIHPKWNACHGGSPEQLINAIKDGYIPLIYVNSDGFGWFGYARTLKSMPESQIKLKDEAIVHENINEKIQMTIMSRGSIVLGINSNCISEADINGFINSEMFGPKNHAVCVVGWKTWNGIKYWIARNSWGETKAPVRKPDDTTCVGLGQNNCKVDTFDWKGDTKKPGYVYIPFDYGPIKGSPSPWFFCDPNV